MKNFNICGFFLIIFFSCGSDFLIGSQKLEKYPAINHMLGDIDQVIPSHPFTLSLDAVKAESKRAAEIQNFISYFPWVQQGFNILSHQGVQFDYFDEAIHRLLITDILDDNYVLRKEGFEFSDIIDEVVNELFEKMNEPFFEALIDAFKKYQDEKQLDWDFLNYRYHHKDMHIDQIFHYVLNYKKSFMKEVVDQWINDWFNNGGQQLLYIMMEPKNLNKILILLNLPVDLTQVDDQGKTILLSAIENENIQLLKKILEQIKNNPENLDLIINQPDNQQMTPLDYAIIKNNLRIVELLLQAGAQLNGNNGHDSPLHRAVLIVNKDIIELLLKFGADRSILDEQGLTPLEFAQNQLLDLEKELEIALMMQFSWQLIDALQEEIQVTMPAIIVLLS